MEKNYKYALALLYLLQLMIVFRESVAEAYKHAVEAIHGKVELTEADVAAAAVAEEGRHQPSTEQSPAIVHGAITLLPFAMTHAAVNDESHEALHHDDHVHPETEELAKKMRRKRWREILLANLFMSTRRFAEPAQAENAPAFTLLRPVSFPAA